MSINLISIISHKSAYRTTQCRQSLVKALFPRDSRLCQVDNCLSSPINSKILCGSCEDYHKCCEFGKATRVSQDGTPWPNFSLTLIFSYPFPELFPEHRREWQDGLSELTHQQSFIISSLTNYETLKSPLTIEKKRFTVQSC